MIELQITLQILGVIALMLLIAVLGYVLYILGRFGKKLDSVIEMITYYEKFKVVVVDFIEGPGKMYMSILQTIFSFISPLLTKRRKTK